MNIKPIWSRDGKLIAYTQEQAKGTDSNIFVADVATGKSTLSPRMKARSSIRRMIFRPMAKHLLITSNAANGFQNAALLDLDAKKING